MSEEKTDEKNYYARSIVERHFFLLVQGCRNCGNGPLEFVSTEQTSDGAQDIWTTRCKKCRLGNRLIFSRSCLMVDEQETALSILPQVNPTNEPSRLIDVGQWVALFQHIISKAACEKDRRESQRLGYEATLCLEEALKFYDKDNDLPPTDAIWTETTREFIRQKPEGLLRQKLISMREKLPSLQVMRVSMGEAKENEKETAPKRPWWKKWFKK